MNPVPWFEDFEIGQELSDVPAVTLTEAHAAFYQALTADRMRLPLDHNLAQRVTKVARPLAHPGLVCNMAIGQTTIPSQRVVGNLFYRGVVLQRQVFLGDTLSTTTRVVALRQNKPKPGRDATGMVALEMHVTNQDSDTVMLFWRCPMVPCRDKDADTRHADDFSLMPESLDNKTLVDAMPDWDLTPLKSYALPTVDETVVVEARDTVTSAPELVRLSLNLAMTHTDAAQSVFGKRLVYGGHTIGIAGAQLSRVIPGAATILAWHHCDHTAPVFEQDVLRSEITLKSIEQYARGRIAEVLVETYADRGSEAPEAGTDIKVLDWSVAVLVP